MLVVCPSGQKRIRPNAKLNSPKANGVGRIFSNVRKSLHIVYRKPNKRK